MDKRRIIQLVAPGVLAEAVSKLVTLLTPCVASELRALVWLNLAFCQRKADG